MADYPLSRDVLPNIFLMLYQTKWSIILRPPFFLSFSKVDFFIYEILCFHIKSKISLLTSATNVAGVFNTLQTKVNFEIAIVFWWVEDMSWERKKQSESLCTSLTSIDGATIPYRFKWKWGDSHIGGVNKRANEKPFVDVNQRGTQNLINSCPWLWLSWLSSLNSRGEK